MLVCGAGDEKARCCKGKTAHRPLFVLKKTVTEEATNVLSTEQMFLRWYNAAWSFRGLPSSNRATPTAAMYSVDSSATNVYFPRIFKLGYATAQPRCELVLILHQSMPDGILLGRHKSGGARWDERGETHSYAYDD